MDRKTKRKMQRYVQHLQEERPPILGEGLLDRGHPVALRLRMSYQVWLARKVQAKFPQVPLLEAVTEVIAVSLD